MSAINNDMSFYTGNHTKFVLTGGNRSNDELSAAELGRVWEELEEAWSVPVVPVLPKPRFEGPSYEEVEALRKRSMGGLFLKREI